MFCFQIRDPNQRRTAVNALRSRLLPQDIASDRCRWQKKGGWYGAKMQSSANAREQCDNISNRGFEPEGTLFVLPPKLENRTNEPAVNSVCEANPRGDVSERVRWTKKRGKRSGSNTATGKRKVAQTEPMLQQVVGSSPT